MGISEVCRWLSTWSFFCRGLEKETWMLLSCCFCLYNKVGLQLVTRTLSINADKMKLFNIFDPQETFLLQLVAWLKLLTTTIKLQKSFKENFRLCDVCLKPSLNKKEGSELSSHQIISFHRYISSIHWQDLNPQNIWLSNLKSQKILKSKLRLTLQNP